MSATPDAFPHTPDAQLDALELRLKTLQPCRSFGRIANIGGLMVQVEGLQNVPMGGRCHIEDSENTLRPAEVIGHHKGQTMLMPFGTTEGLAPGGRVFPDKTQSRITINHSFIGRVVDGLGQPVDGKGPIAALGGEERLLKALPPPAGSRQPVGGMLNTGVRVLNTLVPLCKGQRLGIFAGSGVGKSVLMSMVARRSSADVNVIGLIGERGREVREFVEEYLGEEGLARSVVVVATGDESPLLRRQAAYLTLTIGEYFRDCGFDCLLMMDSVTRFALAQREIGLASGEPPTTRGFTPSVFAELPKLLERAGPGLGRGSLTALFTVLVEGGDMDEPVADAVRGIMDGHVVMSRKLAEQGHFPAVDVLASISRMAPGCYTPEQHAAVKAARQFLSTYADMEELIRLGAYTAGSSKEVDAALNHMPALRSFLQQAPEEATSLDASFSTLQDAVR